MDFRVGLVPAILPGHNFERQGPFIRQTAFETLTREDTQLNFSHIEPGAVRWSGVKTQALHQTIRLDFAKGFDQGVIGVGIQVVEDDINHVGVGVQRVNQIAHGLSKVGFAPSLCDENRALSRLGFHKQEEIARAVGQSRLGEEKKRGILSRKGHCHE